MPYADRSLVQDNDRLQALYDLCLLDTPTDPSFDRLTQLATKILGVPVALVSLVDADRQFFKSCVGLPEPYATIRETPLSHSFCQHVVATAEPLIITDAREHPLVYDNLAIPDLNVIAYLGMPLTLETGETIGSFCVIDDKPRQWTDDEIEILRDLTATVLTEIDLRVQLTLRRESEQKQREQERFFEKVLEQIPTPITLYDFETQEVIYSNRQLETFYGYPDMDDKPLTLKQMANLVHPDDAAKLEQRVSMMGAKNPIMQRTEPFDVKEYRVKHYDGTWRWVQTYSIISEYQLDGTPKLLLSIVMDVTQQKQADANAQQIAIEREQIRLLRDFVINVSHDLRSPLASIQLKLDLLKRNPDPTKNDKRIAAIQNQLDHLRAAMDDFAAVSDMHNTELYQPKEIDLNQVVRRGVHWMLHSQDVRFKRKINFNLAQELPHIHADPDKLQLAIASLIENAILFSNADSEITVTTRQDDATLQVIVQDTGIGIPKAHLPHIFDAFYKVNDARTHNHSKSGMGLTLAKQIVELHAGHITLDSIEGQGTTVTIILPVAPQFVHSYESPQL